VEIDLQDPFLVQNLEEALSTDCIHGDLTIDEITRGESLQEGFGLREVDRQVDHEIDILSEPGLAVEGCRDTAREVVMEP
jgi:hypothetical protein